MSGEETARDERLDEREHTPQSRFGYLTLLVTVGGFLGTTARYAVSKLFDDVSAWPLATLAVNVVGAFALGLLLERLASGGPESAVGRNVRLLVGTGFLGSFTTYSSFAVETERLLATGSGPTAVGYVAASLGVGVLSCIAGVTAGSWWADRRHSRGRA